MDMPRAAHLSRDDCNGFARVSDVSGLKMGGWYEMITEVGEASASLQTAGVRLLN
jgi:hypothetical protein